MGQADDYRHGEENERRKNMKSIQALSSKNEEQALVIRDLVAAIEEGAQVNTPDLMEWVAERLIFVHDESPHVDYVLSLRRRAEKLRKASENARAAIAKAKQP